MRNRVEMGYPNGFQGDAKKEFPNRLLTGEVDFGLLYQEHVYPLSFSINLGAYMPKEYKVWWHWEWKDIVGSPEVSLEMDADQNIQLIISFSVDTNTQPGCLPKEGLKVSDMQIVIDSHIIILPIRFTIISR